MQILLVLSVGEVKPLPEERVYSKIGPCQWKKYILNRVFISRNETNRGPVKESVLALKKSTFTWNNISFMQSVTREL